MTAAAPKRRTTRATATVPQEEIKVVSDLDVILPMPDTIEIAGCRVKVQRLRSREILALVGIMIEGIGPGVQNVPLDMEDKQALATQFGALFAMALPNALDQFVDLLGRLVIPLDREDRATIAAEMENPEIETLLDVLTVVGEQEIDDLFSLVGKAAAAMTRMQGLYQNRALRH